MYKCPQCGDEMVVAQEPVGQAMETKDKDSLYPCKIVYHLIQLFSCAKCNIRVAKTETKDYYSNVD